ncbi:hypothetical protein [Ferrimonas balearica]|uniref:hypothetical protein n=1 Tax=Ferrimonas balearica TaxID=44012 RepID=UPI001C95C25C|nr:hypothetical protein [Ferrimonas balearica]MBY5979225.1 outer membrane beta-barrel protein [Ferrimonas balearica]
MAKWLLLTACLCSLLFVHPVQAFDFHVGAGAGMFQADDPEIKSSQTPSGFVLMGAKYSLSRNSAVVSELQYSAFTSDAKTNRMGLKAKSIDWSLAYSYQYPFSYQVRPMINIGGFVSQFSLKDRHRIDENGYLIRQYDDHSTITGGLITSIHHDFEIDRFDSAWGLGIQIKYAFSGVNSIGAYASYRF